MVGKDLTGAVKALAQLPDDEAGLTGTGPCDLFDPSGAVAPAGVASLTHIVVRRLREIGSRRREHIRGRASGVLDRDALVGVTRQPSQTSTAIQTSTC